MNRCLRLQLENLEPRELLTATVVEHADIGYFFDQDEAIVNRYDIQAERWLSPIELELPIGPTSAAHVDADGIYVAYGRALYRYDHDGGTSSHILNTARPITGLTSEDHFLFAAASEHLSINKSTNELVDVRRLSYRHAFLTSPIHDNVILASPNAQPGSRTWHLPGVAKLMDSEGTVYSSDRLLEIASVPSTVVDAAFFAGEVPILLGSGQITAYSAGFQATGSRAAPRHATEIFVNDANVIVFTADPTSPHGYDTQVVAVSTLNPVRPGGWVNPIGLHYTPDAIQYTRDGQLLIFSASQQSIFRWDPHSQQYTDTIALAGIPSYMAYSAENNAAYVAYHSGSINKLALDSPDVTEVAFAELYDEPYGLDTAGKYVFSTTGKLQFTFGIDGATVGVANGVYVSRNFAWSDANQEMYYSTTNPPKLMSREINADGVTYPGKAPGQFGKLSLSPSGIISQYDRPMRLSPDGQLLIRGSSIYETDTFARSTMSLPDGVIDAVWLGDRVMTIGHHLGDTHLQAWKSDSFAEEGARKIPGRAYRIFVLSDERAVVVTMLADMPTFTVVDKNLNVVLPALTSDAGDDTFARVGESVVLSGVKSVDQNVEPQPLSYLWQIVSGPERGAKLTKTDSEIAEFSAAKAGVYVVSLTVSDGNTVATDTVRLTIGVADVPHVLPGDADGDGEVVFRDFLLLASHFGQSDVSHFEGDFNGDGTIDFADFLILSANYRTGPAMTADFVDSAFAVF